MAGIRYSVCAVQSDSKLNINATREHKDFNFVFTMLLQRWFTWLNSYWQHLLSMIDICTV